MLPPSAVVASAMLQQMMGGQAGAPFMAALQQSFLALGGGFGPAGFGPGPAPPPACPEETIAATDAAVAEAAAARGAAAALAGVLLRSPGSLFAAYRAELSPPATAGVLGAFAKPGYVEGLLARCCPGVGAGDAEVAAALARARGLPPAFTFAAA